MNDIKSIPLRQNENPTFFKEISLSIKDNINLILLSAFIFSIIAGIFYQLSPIKTLDLPAIEMCQSMENTRMCLSIHQTEVMNEAIKAGKAIYNNGIILLLISFGSMLSIAFAYYYFALYYIKKEINDAPKYSLSGFWRYISLVSWKYTRPILWNFIPIFGQIMYIRSILRYELVGYLTLMEDKEPLKTSWEMTKDNAINILAVQMFLLLLLLVSYLFPTPSTGILSILIDNFFMGIIYAVSIISSFAIFSVLKKSQMILISQHQ